jgi:hypothetical protein
MGWPHCLFCPSRQQPLIPDAIRITDYFHIKQAPGGGDIFDLSVLGKTRKEFGEAESPAAAGPSAVGAALVNTAIAKKF